MKCRTLQCINTEKCVVHCNWYNAVRYSVAQLNRVKYSTVHCNAIQCCTVHCNAIQCNAIHVFSLFVLSCLQVWNKLLSTFSKVDDSNSLTDLLQVCSSKFDIVWT